MNVDFVKMQGNGNDFVVVDEWSDEAVPENRKPEFASRVCDRHYGVGANGVVFVRSSEEADVGMRLFQPDGGEAEMCGNGVRCLVRYAVTEGYADEGGVTVETPAGIRGAKYEEGDPLVTVDMGTPSFEPGDVPAERTLVQESLEGYSVTAVNTGVPHAVVFVDDVDAVDVEGDAPPIRHADVFPEGANVNFASRKGEGFEVRTFERGVEAETLSCGTGAAAVAAAALKLNMVDPSDVVLVSTSGGDLHVYFEDGTAYMQGPAERVFEGSISVP